MMRLLLLVTSLLGTGCATQNAPVPARLTTPDAQTIARVKGILALALGRNEVVLGAVDFTTSTMIPVLPPALAPFDGRSLAAPILFDIVKQGETCAVVARADQRSYPLTGIACTAV